MRIFDTLKSDMNYALESGREVINGTTKKVAKSPLLGVLGAAAQPLLINIIASTARNGAYLATKTTERTLFANRQWMSNEAVQENITTQIANIPDSAIGFMPTASALVDLNLNIPMPSSYIPKCQNMLGDMLQVDTQRSANELVEQFIDQCSSPEAFTGNRLELFIRNLGQVAQDTGHDLANRVTETASHPLASWLQALGFSTRTDEDGLAQIAFSPDSILPLASLAVALYGADYGLRQLSVSRNNPVANLYNRPLKELNGLEKSGRFILDGVLAAGTIGSLFGIIESIN